MKSGLDDGNWKEGAHSIDDREWTVPIIMVKGKGEGDPTLSLREFGWELPLWYAHTYLPY